MAYTFELSTGHGTYQCVDLPASAGGALSRMPWLHRILLENVLRRAGDAAGKLAATLIEARGSASTDEIPFYPCRVLMHDTTFTPAFVDIAGMRQWLAENGGDPTRLNPVLPVDVSVDHSISVDHFGTRNALALNTEAEFKRNHGRYRFMKWASRALQCVRIHPPGTGIMHTINLERLAHVVATERWRGEHWAYPDTLIGTDSHTTMINGIGVLAWGVGGLEAESVLFGMPVMLRVPNVVGVRLVGSLPSTTMATDLALVVTERLRQLPLAGRFVEFFGPGVSTLSAGSQAVVANMAPEFGASSGFFPIDAETIKYLANTGRTPSSLRLVELYATRQQLWFDPEAQPEYSEVVEINLSDVTMSLAGPRRPQDRLSPSCTASTMRRIVGDRDLHAHSIAAPGDGAIAIAAITSCTNTSDPRLIVAAALLARNARRRGLKPPAWVKTSCAPGSPSVERYLQKAGLLEDLEALGFGVVGYGCTTCIGNSGPLTAIMTDTITERGIVAVAVLSGNRNFPGRIHPLIDSAFLASPTLSSPMPSPAMSCAIFSRIRWRSRLRGRLCTSPNCGRRLRRSRQRWCPLIPPTSERPTSGRGGISGGTRSTGLLDRCSPGTIVLPRSGVPPSPPQTLVRRSDVISPTRCWFLETTSPPTISRRLERSIPRAMLAVTSSRRVRTHFDLNVFAARRGNWEVMRRGLFTNRALSNLLAPELMGGQTIHVPSGETIAAWRAAERYQEEGIPLILWAGERYGTGSSRDWAAKGLALLGVRAVLAVSFERIHRSNLVGIGILPVRIPSELNPERLKIVPGDRVEVDADPARLAPQVRVPMRLVRADGVVTCFEAIAEVETSLEADLLRHGGMIPYILRRVVSDSLLSTPVACSSQ